MNGGELYRKLGDWYHNNTDPLIPQAGMDFPEALVDEFQVFWNMKEIILLEGFNLHGMPDNRVVTKPPCHVINLPLIVGLHSGLSHKKLTEIAKQHPLNAQGLIKTLDVMSNYGYTMEDIFEEHISTAQLYIKGMKVISEVFPETFSIHLSEMDEMSGINNASLLSDNPEHWPVTRLSALMKAYDQGSLKPSEFFDAEFFNKNDALGTDDYIPKDAEGLPDYATFLVRSGMLLPEVSRKKMGEIGLWEQMLDVAKYDEGLGFDDRPGMSGVLHYCLNNANDQLKPSIFRAFANMAMVNIRGVDDGLGLYNFLRNKTFNTWLAPLFDSPLLLINMIAEQGKVDLRTRQDFKATPEQRGVGISVLNNPETLLDRCLKEIMATTPNEMGASHFRVFLLEKLNPPKQVLCKDLQPEQVIKHMLQGLEGFSVHESTEWLRSSDTHESAVNGCNYVIKTLAGLYDLDYAAFKGLGSSSVKVLVEAGLDKRKLPRMNGRDKGRVLSEELGL
jgi:hypothetical protein